MEDSKLYTYEALDTNGKQICQGSAPMGLLCELEAADPKIASIDVRSNSVTGTIMNGTARVTDR